MIVKTMDHIVSPEQMHQFTRFKIYFNLMNKMVYIKGVIKKLPILVLFSSCVNVIKNPYAKRIK